jgi:hypothetical protein
LFPCELEQWSKIIRKSDPSPFPSVQQAVVSSGRGEVVWKKDFFRSQQSSGSP